MKKKLSVTVIALILSVVCTVSVTLAWLMDKTDSVTNTFTVGDVTITLTESPLNADGTYGTPAENVSNTYKVIPGTEYKKDPKVTVKGGSEACYLFVKFEETGSPSSYFDYTSTLTTENGWTQGTGDIPADVWYREVGASAGDQSWELLLDNGDGYTLTVNATNVTKENVSAAAAAKLVYTAYAVQKANVNSAADAWVIANS